MNSSFFLVKWLFIAMDWVYRQMCALFSTGGWVVVLTILLFTLVYAKSRNETVRVGLSVSKRIGNAVQRNRAKRRMRAALTPFIKHIAGGFNVIFVARQEVLTAPFEELSRQMETLLRRAELWRDEA